MEEKIFTISSQAIQAHGLTKAAVIGYLVKYAQDDPSIIDIMRDCGLSQSTASRTIKELTQSEVLKIEKGFRNKNKYIIDYSQNEYSQIDYSQNDERKEENQEERKQEEKRKEKNQKKTNKEEINKEEIKEENKASYAHTREETEILYSKPEQNQYPFQVEIWCEVYRELFKTDYQPDFRWFTTELTELTTKIFSKKNELVHNNIDDISFYKQFLLAMYQVSDQWEQSRYEAKFLNANFNKLYQRIKNGQVNNPTDNKPQYSDKLKSRIAQFVAKYGEQ